jgi:hypothetical protein
MALQILEALRSRRLAQLEDSAARRALEQQQE